MKHLIWLCSYPKSGNTWLRILLDSMFYYQGQRVDINRIKTASKRIIKRQSFDEFLEFESDGLTSTEILYFKRKYYLDYGLKAGEDIFVKTHEANWSIEDSQNLIPEEVTKHCVYIVRNPLDVVCSLAGYHALSLDQATELLNNSNYTLFGPEDGISHNVPVKVGNWSLNVDSWLNTSNLPLTFIRYEDLLNHPIETLGRVMEDLNRPFDRELIQNAVENHSFEQLADQEARDGFLERPRKADSFFRKGKSESWKEELSGKQVDRIKKAHHSIMEQLGYLI